jgi:hypothetical protein
MALKMPVRSGKRGLAKLARRRVPKPTKGPTGLTRVMEGVGTHGTRNWNFDEMRRFGSAETYYYAPRDRSELAQMPKQEVGERFRHSIGRNVSYWFDKHAITVKDASGFAREDFPTIVFVKHQRREGMLPDDVSMSHRDRMEPTFRAFSAPLESRDVLGSVTVDEKEYSDVIARLSKSGRLNKNAFVKELTRILVPKARKFVMTRG